MVLLPGVLWIKAAVVYFIMGVSLGIYMGASGDHLLVPVHAHFNLVGWASLALVGLIYHQFPTAGSSRLFEVPFGRSPGRNKFAESSGGRLCGFTSR
jgi:hypothetical protein